MLDYWDSLKDAKARKGTDKQLKAGSKCQKAFIYSRQPLKSVSTKLHSVLSSERVNRSVSRHEARKSIIRVCWLRWWAEFCLIRVLRTKSVGSDVAHPALVLNVLSCFVSPSAILVHSEQPDPNINRTVRHEFSLGKTCCSVLIASLNIKR